MFTIVWAYILLKTYIYELLVSWAYKSKVDYSITPREALLYTQTLLRCTLCQKYSETQYKTEGGTLLTQITGSVRDTLLFQIGGSTFLTRIRKEHFANSDPEGTLC